MTQKLSGPIPNVFSEIAPTLKVSPVYPAGRNLILPPFFAEQNIILPIKKNKHGSIPFNCLQFLCYFVSFLCYFVTMLLCLSNEMEKAACSPASIPFNLGMFTASGLDVRGHKFNTIEFPYLRTLQLHMHCKYFLHISFRLFFNSLHPSDALGCGKILTLRIAQKNLAV